MNYFFAITLPDKAREQLAAFAERWERQIDPAFRARWYLPEDYHVTLKFLGNISEDLVPQAIRDGKSNAMQRNIDYPGPIIISQKPLTTFPSLVKPQVLWVEVALSERLRSLMFGLHLALREQGVKPDFRPFKPHLTLARCSPTTEVPPFILEERAFDNFTVDCFHLMQTLPPESRANGAKARYNLVHTFPFGNAPPLDVS